MLILETDIGKFMNKLMPQAKLWRDLAERMRNSPIFSEKKKVLVLSSPCSKLVYIIYYFNLASLEFGHLSTTMVTLEK